jgi:Protein CHLORORESPIRATORY REDUCTION 7
MPDSMMYYEDNFVLLSPEMTEQFVTLPELEDILANLLTKMQDNLPYDLQKISSIEAQVQRLIKTACDLDCGDSGVWQWYVVRLEKPGAK